MNFDEGVLALERNPELVDEDPNFFDKLKYTIDENDNEEFHDPIMLSLIKEPIILSSGHLFDKTSVCEANGKLKIKICPISN